jgi:hypothetical protein
MPFINDGLEGDVVRSSFKGLDGGFVLVANEDDASKESRVLGLLPSVPDNSCFVPDAPADTPDFPKIGRAPGADALFTFPVAGVAVNDFPKSMPRLNCPSMFLRLLPA